MALEIIDKCLKQLSTLKNYKTHTERVYYYLSLRLIVGCIKFEL